MAALTQLAVEYGLTSLQPHLGLLRKDRRTLSPQPRTSPRISIFQRPSNPPGDTTFHRPASAEPRRFTR